MKTRILSWPELVAWVADLPPSMTVAMLLCGDRLSCCDEAVGVEVGGRIVGVATIAPQGEQMSGQPTIVALYVLSAFRRQGYGRALMAAAIRRCLERGFQKIRVDVLSVRVVGIINSLSEELRSVLDVRDLTSSGVDFLVMLEEGQK